jgi:ubiquinone/menaquinone biosynthesis C-methylase UbiE
VLDQANWWASSGALGTSGPHGDHLLSEALRGVRLVPADATGSGLPTESFDLTHTRHLLINVPDPDAVLREMVRLTRPEGSVVCQEFDLTLWDCKPAHPDWDLLRGELITVYAGDITIGRKLPSMLTAAGLVNVQVKR